MGRLKALLNLLVLAVAAVIVWLEYQRRSGERAPGAGSPPADDPLAGPIAAVKQGAAQVVTAAAELVRPAAETLAGVVSDRETAGSEGADSAAPSAAETNEASVPEGAVRGDGSTVCPEAFPIKGNATSRIYHQPGTASYERTVPELCFASEAAAETAGYRAPRN